MPLPIRRDPRLDPRLTPDQWDGARKRYRAVLAMVLVLLFSAAGYGGYRYTQTLDKTRGLSAAQVAEAAGMALVKAGGYHFTAQLTGQSPDGFFPNALMKGQFQREPLLLHLAGEAGSGEQKVPLEYYLEGTSLYVKSPRGGTWLQVKDAKLDELYAFQPDNLAAPLVTGVRSADVVGREELAGGAAVQLKLDLDPKVMRLQPPGENERVEYRLWVYTRSLRPAQFSIAVARGGQASSFQYLISWEFPEQVALAVPDEVKQGAQGQ